MIGRKRGKAMANLIGILLCCSMVLAYDFADQDEALIQQIIERITNSPDFKNKLQDQIDSKFNELMLKIDSLEKKSESIEATKLHLRAETTSLPHIPLNLCTSSKSVYEDCLKYKVSNGSDAAFTCTLESSQAGCMDLINSGKADITNIDIKNAKYAQSKNLKPVAFPEHKVIKSLIVVNDPAKYKSFGNLQGLFGCFSEFGNIAYMSFLVKLNEMNLLNTLLGYDSAITYFLGDSCVPGILAVDHDELKMDKLCSCRSIADKTYRSCNLDSDNQWYGNEGALLCLNEMKGFAVITTEDVKNDKSVTALCKNGTLAATPGLEVDENCYLSIVVAEEFMMRKTDSNWTNILFALEEIPKHFNISLINPVKTYIDVFNLTTNKEYFNKTTNWDQTIYKDIISFQKIYSNYTDNTNAVNSSPSLLAVFNLLIIFSLINAFV